MKTPNSEELVPAFMRPDTAALYCDCSRRWLSKLAAQGSLPVIRPSKRLTLYARADLDKLMRSFRIGSDS